MLRHEEGNRMRNLYIYLSAADDDKELAKGWHREAYVRLMLLNLIPPYKHSIYSGMFTILDHFVIQDCIFLLFFDAESQMGFMHEHRAYGFSFGMQCERHNDYLVDDTIKLQVSMNIVRAFPMTKDDNEGNRRHKFRQYVSSVS